MFFNEMVCVSQRWSKFESRNDGGAESQNQNMDESMLQFQRYFLQRN